MKKLLIMLSILVLTLFAITSCGCEHIDKNDDGKCDVCGDAFEDGKDLPDDPCTAHTDANGDDKCDICGANYAHTCTPGHTVTENRVESTCLEKGSCDEVVYCSVCQKEMSRTQKTLDYFGAHDFVDRVCTVCDTAALFNGPARYVRCNKDGVADANGTYLLFGEFPQSLKAETVEITETQDARGYFLGSDGAYYAKVVANPWEFRYSFDTGDSVVSGVTYYFKVEPIRWRILSEKNGSAFILCDSIITGMPYQSDVEFVSGTPTTTANGAAEGTAANNYVYSDIRAWLNSTFYETSFTELEKELIRQCVVDNSAASMGYTQSNFACENTNDKVFLLSVAEVTNAAYGFAGANAMDIARRIVTSDYARAVGVYMDTRDAYLGQGCWWLRSAAGFGTGATARYVYFAGTANEDYNVVNTEYGIVPAMQIFLCEE